MKRIYILTLTLLAAALTGCDTPRNVTSVMATEEYAAREPITESLFPADQAVLGDEAVERILASKLELPARAKVALIKFPGSAGEGSRYYSYSVYYWRDETQLKIRQRQIDTLSQALAASDQIAEVTPLPSLMTPSRPAIPSLREAAVRMQADLLLVYRVGSDTYSQYRMFSKDKVKAISTCEIVLLDVRTGLVPFTRVVSRERTESKQPTDFDLSETMRRAEEDSSSDALKEAADDLVTFMKSMPKKGS
jgi:hypothetical protein